MLEVLFVLTLDLFILQITFNDQQREIHLKFGNFLRTRGQPYESQWSTEFKMASELTGNNFFNFSTLEIFSVF